MGSERATPSLKLANAGPVLREVSTTSFVPEVGMRVTSETLRELRAFATEKPTDPNVRRLLELLCQSSGGVHYSDFRAKKTGDRSDALCAAVRKYAERNLQASSSTDSACCFYPSIVRDTKYRGSSKNPFLLPVWQVIGKKAHKLNDVHPSVIEWLQEIGPDNAYLIGGKGAGRSSAPSTREMARIERELSKRLQDEFHFTGQHAGEFFSPEGQAVGPSYQSYKPGDGPLSEKPEYYLTYWGWRAALRLVPEKVRIWRPVTVEAITHRLSIQPWIACQIRTTNDSAASVPPRETVRHTTRAAHILFLLGESGGPVSTVAWNLIDEADQLMEGDGWREFRKVASGPALLTSLYIFHFLSDLIANGEKTIVNFSRFVDRATPLLLRTEKYLAQEWESNQWKLPAVPWQVNAPMTLAEYAPYAKNLALVGDVRRDLAELVKDSGGLADPTVGNGAGAPEFTLSVRIAYALCAGADPQQYESITARLLRRILGEYCSTSRLDTHDLAYLTELILPMPK